MAGLPVVYPDTLPHPEVGQFTPRERRAINREFMRPISRDRAGTRSVAFTFTPVQAREFREWYQEWVTMGGGMFAAPWPMPWGRGPHVFRFVEPPTWQLIGGGIDGQGYWRVTADVELRGRGEMPELEVFTVTSQLYPVFESDGVGPNTRLLPSELLKWPAEAVKPGAVVLAGGELRSIYQVYELPHEDVAPSINLVNGALVSIYISYNIPREEIGPSGLELTGGELRQILIQYTNWPTEEVAPSNILITGGELS